MNVLRFGIFAVILLLPASMAAQSGRTVMGKGGATTEKSTAKGAAKSSSTAEEWLQAQTRTGDDLPRLLERYGLYDHECNVEKFFKINGLKESHRLPANRAYKLPVKIVAYNGKTIRSTLSIDDWKTAKRIETYNVVMKDQGLRPDDFRTSKQLWVPWHELNCPNPAIAVAAMPRDEETEPAPAKGRSETRAGIISMEKETAKGSRVFPIFGTRYARTPLVSKRMKGRVFYVVSGHGGPDVGAEGRRGKAKLCEDEYAYDVSLRLARLLIGHGATVYMIVRDPNDGIRDTEILPCDKDEFVYGDLTIPRPQKERLRQRTDLINDLTERNRKAGLNDQTLVEIHVDSRSRHTKTDVFFYYRPESDPSKSLARHIHRTFYQKYLKVRSQRGYTGTVTGRDLFTLRETGVPKAVYIELGNIRNDWDQQRLVVASNRQAVANWIAEALLTKR